MAITRIRNNQVYNSDINAQYKLQPYSVTGGLLANNFTYTGNLTVGNLIVNGLTTTIDTTNLVIADPLFAINRNQSGSPSYDLGFVMGRGNQTNVAMIWEENSQQFQLQYTTESTAATTFGTINNSGFANLQAYGIKVNNATIGTSNVTNFVGSNVAITGGTINNTTIGATTPNSGVFTSVTTASGGQLTGYLTGAIGANTPNTAVFTTVTTSGNITAQTANVYAAYVVANTATYGAQYYWTNGATLASTITGTYSNSNVASYLPTYNGSVGNLSTGNLLPLANTSYYLGNSTLYWANVYANYFVTATEIVTPKVYFPLGGSTITEDNSLDLLIQGPYQVSIKPNGSYQYTFGNDGRITGPGGTFVYANGALYGNLIGTGAYWSNGVSLASTITGTYSNSNVASYLPTYSGNLSAGNLNITNGGQVVGYLNGTIGANAPNSGAFTTVTTSGSITSGNQVIGYINGAFGANAPNTVVATSVTTTNGGQHSGYLTGAIGANTPNSGAFTSLTTSGTIVSQGTITGAGQIIGYLNGSLGANTPNTVVATSVTTSNGGQLSGYLTGAIGANIPNSGVFTSITTSGSITSGNQVVGYLNGIIGANSANSATFTTVTSSGNITAQTANIYANYFVANTGYVGLVLTNTQPYITSVGTLTSLSVSGSTTFNTIAANSISAGFIGNSGSQLYGANIAITGNALILNGLALNSNATILSDQTTANIFNTTTTTLNIGNAATTINLAKNDGTSVVKVNGTANSYGSGQGALQISGGFYAGGDSYIAGNLSVTGNLTSVGYNELIANAPLLYLSVGSISTYNYELGFYSHKYDAVEGYNHTGFVRNHVDNAWFLFSNIRTEPTNTVDLANASIIYDTLKLGNIIAYSGNTSTSTTTGAAVIYGGMGVGGNIYAAAIQGTPIGNGVASTGAFTTLTATTNITAQTSNVYAANLVGNTAVYSGQYYWTNGATLSSTITGTYSNSNVASYLPTYTGALTASSITTVNGGQIAGYLTGPIGANSANSGVFTTLIASSNITAQTANVYAAYLISNTATYSAQYYWTNGATLASTITGTYSNSNVAAYLPVYNGNLSAGNITTVSGGQISGYFTGAIGSNIANSGAFTNVTATGTIIAQGNITSANQIIGYLNGAIGANSPNTATFTTVVTSGNITAQTANVYAAYVVANTGSYSTQYYWTNGATLASTITGTYSNSNVASYLPTYTGTLSPSSLTTNSGGQVNAYLNGAIGANTPNSGVFTTIVSSGNITAQTANVYAAYVVSNSGLNGTLITNAQPYITSVGTLANLTTSGNITAQTANIYASNIIANTAIYGGSYFYSNGFPFAPTAAGSNTFVQFNNNGVFGGANYLQYNLTSGNLVSNSTSNSTSTTTGAIVVAGGVGVGGNIYSGANIVASSAVIAPTMYNSNIYPIIGSDLYKNTGPNGNLWINYNGYTANVIINGNTTSGYGNLFVVNGLTGQVGIKVGTSAIVPNASLMVNSTDSILVPVGSTSQRPSSSVAGMIRYNNQSNQLEFYNGTSWQGTGSSFTTVTAQQFTGDGTTTVFTLSQSATTASTIVSINGVLQIPTTAYTVSGTTLTFTEAPLSTDIIDARIVVTTSIAGSIGDQLGNTVVANSNGITVTTNYKTTLISNVGGNYINGGFSALTPNIALTQNTPTIIDSFSTSFYRVAKYVIKVTDGTNNVYCGAEVIVAHNGTTATSQVYGVVNTGGNALATFSSTVSGGNVNVTANTWSSTASATVFPTYMPI